ncbi:hypothetical protein SLS64_005795 [Diaporthe eres]
MRIFTYGYNAEFMKAGGRSSTSTLDFAKNLLYDLRFFIDDAAVDLNIGKASILSSQVSSTGLMMVVEKDSSILGYPGEISKGLDADHHTVCKYGDREDPNYVTVRNFIRTQISNLLPSRKGGSRASAMSASPADIRELEKLFSITEATDTDYIACRDRWTPGTCEWILSNSSFARWLDDPDPDARILWLHGAAGCGKSIMTSFIVNHLVENNKSCQYAFVRFGDQAKRSLSMMFRTLAFQVALVSPAFRQEISKAASSLKRGVDAAAIWRRVFKNMLFQSEFETPLYWVIDGLEESDNPRAGIKMLTDVLGTSVPLRILILSRRTPEIDAEFKKIPEEAKWDAVSIDGHLDDHRRFIENELEWSEIPAFKESITKRLLDQSQGSFLWLRLTVERINKCRTTESVEQAMRELPAGMQELYDRMGQSISEQESADRSFTCQILAWVTCAIRTLSVGELIEALGSQSQARSISDPCAGFISVDNFGNVTLIHQTAKEYLLSSKGRPYSVEKNAAHDRICSRCLQCLTKNGLRRDITKGLEPSLLGYAATHWSTHMIAVTEVSKELLESVVQFLRSTSVLTWIHAVTKAEQIHVLVHASSNLALLAKRLARSNAEKMPLDRQTDEKELIEAWAIDLGKIVGRFGSQLLHMPESIYKTIPPFCPPDSPMFKQFGRKQKSNLTVGHFSNATWGDSLGQLSLRRDEKATALVTEGKWIAISTDAESMVSTVVIYHASTFQQARRLDIGERVRKMQINSLGTLVVTCGIRTTKVWNIAAGTCVTTAASPRSRPRPMTITFSKNDASVLIGTDDRRVWSMSLSSSESKVVEVIRFMQKSSGGRSVNSPTCMAISPDGQQVCLGYRSSPLAVWETDLAEEVARQDDLEDVAEILWHPFSGEVFGRQASGFIFKWHPDMGDPERQRAEVSTMAISSDGTLLALGSHKGGFKLLSTSDMTFIHQGVSEHPVFGLAFSWDNQQLYDIRGNYGNVWQPDSLLRFSEPTAQLSDGGSVSGRSGRTASSEETWYEFLDPISALAPHSRGTVFCSGSERGVLTIHDTKDLKLRKLDGFTSFGIEEVAWSNDGRYICFGDLSRTIFVVFVRGDEDDIDKMNFELHLKLSLDFSDNITQAIFNNDASMVLVSSRSRAVVISLEGQKTTSELRLQSDNGMWIPHPVQEDSVIFFCPWLMSIHKWSTFSKASSIPISPPSQGNFTQSSGMESRPADNTGEHEHEDENPPEYSTPGHPPFTSNQKIVIERLISAQSRHYLLVEASIVNDGQKRNIVLLLDIRQLSAPISDESPTALGSIFFLELPSSLTNQIDRPLKFLKQRNGIQDTLLFLDCHHSICTWGIPPGISQVVESLKDSATDAVHRIDSQTSTLRDHSYSDKGIVDKAGIAAANY